MGVTSNAAFRTILFLGGAFVIITGIDTGIGGMRTLGWLGSNEFVAITDAYAFSVQDNHSKFLGGLWLGVGLIFWAGAMNPQRFSQALKVAFGLIFLGGLMRVASGNPEIVLTADIIGSWVAELIGMPLLYWWHRQLTSAEKSASV
eukprot:s1_g975.t1